MNNAGPSRPRAWTRPLLASIGTVLIDAFESPPRPNPDLPPPLYTNILGRRPSASIASKIDPNPRPSPLNPASSSSSGSGPAPGTHPVVPLLATTSSSSSGSGPIEQLAPGPRSSSLSRPSSGSAFGPGTGTGTRPPGPGPSSAPSTRSDSAASTPPSTPTRSLSTSDHVIEVLGGGALYHLVGARIWLDPEVGMWSLIDRSMDDPERGIESDFSAEHREWLASYGDMWAWNQGPDTKATKAQIRYDGDVRLFRYIARPPQRSLSALVDTPLWGAEYLHVSPPYGPHEAAALLSELESTDWSPKIVFEPTPPSCKPESKEALESVAAGVHVLSPNHEELLAIYSHPVPLLSSPTFKPLIESIARHLVYTLSIGPGASGSIAIRCGRMGSLVGNREKGLRWFPAYFGPEDASSVIDVTGAGNAYLGGYIAGLHASNEDPFEAALYATVSASFVVEQFCLPNFDPKSSRPWNDDVPSRRLEVYRNRMKALYPVTS